MLSDILCQAVEDIEYYQNEMPDIYDAYRDRLGVIKSAMHSVRIELDSPLAPENDRRLLAVCNVLKRVADTVPDEPLRAEVQSLIRQMRSDPA